ncbi:MAG: peptide deformylase [Pelagibacteraceae bacterium]|nr:peptide deformylase [Pelagibacteraceae bacterium]
MNCVSILKIAKIGHPVLLKKTNEIKQLKSEKLKRIIFDMSETMIDADGIGLAAPQVYLSLKMFIFRNPDQKDLEGKINITALINPAIEILSKETEDDWEGCLSIPGMSGLVRRYKRIRYSGYDFEGNKIVNEVDGLHSRLIQHEFDHLQGILYTSRLAHQDAFGHSEEIEKYWKKNENKEKK